VDERLPPPGQGETILPVVRMELNLYHFPDQKGGDKELGSNDNFSIKLFYLHTIFAFLIIMLKFLVHLYNKYCNITTMNCSTIC
jgi:hypothetical protein